MAVVYVFRISTEGKVRHKLKVLKGNTLSYGWRSKVTSFKVLPKDLFTTTYWLLGVVPLIVPAVFVRDSNYKSMSREALLGDEEDALIGRSGISYGKDLQDGILSMNKLFSGDSKTQQLQLVLSVVILAVLVVILL